MADCRYRRSRNFRDRPVVLPKARGGDGSEYRKKQSEEEIPVGEYGQPADIANLVCFLVSPLARYITGAVIPVDGGLRRYQF